LPETELHSPARDLALISDAAREAGRIALGFFKRKPEVWMKGGTSPVSEADYAADRYLRETLTAARPEYGWLSEETTDGPHRLAARRTFVVDPIDGTRAFLDGRSTWCVSVAVVEKGRPIAGVLDCPAKQEVYAASLGAGASMNGKAIRVTAPRDPAQIAGPKAMVDAAIGRLPSRVERVAYIPSLAYRIAMVADGRLDATFIKGNSQDWDLAAAELVLTEAGGGLSEPSGAPPIYATVDPRHGVLVAASGALLATMIDLVATADLSAI
jgi:myo-inositol-1(or 4)-monophosphatase